MKEILITNKDDQIPSGPPPPEPAPTRSRRTSYKPSPAVGANIRSYGRTVEIPAAAPLSRAGRTT